MFPFDDVIMIVAVIYMGVSLRYQNCNEKVTLLLLYNCPALRNEIILEIDSVGIHITQIVIEDAAILFSFDFLCGTTRSKHSP